MVHTRQSGAFDQGVVAQLIGIFEQKDDLADFMAFRVVGSQDVQGDIDGRVIDELGGPAIERSYLVLGRYRRTDAAARSK